MGKILYINLKSREKNIVEINEESKINYNEDDLIFESSILSGYGIIGVNRLKVSSNSKTSKVGGYFAHYMKCNGYDYIIIQESSEDPVYVHINKDNIIINEANHINNNNPKDTEIIIKKELKDNELEIASLGIAGISGVDFSKIMFRGKKSSGKNGQAKLMGQKNLKAIALKKHENLKPNDENKLKTLNKLIASKIDINNINNWYDEENNCYGCMLNCNSTSIKKISKLGFTVDDSKKIDEICNEHGMDSIVFSRVTSEYIKENDLKDIDYIKFAKNIVNGKIKYNDVLENNKRNKVTNIDNKFEELGFCKFLLAKGIMDGIDIDYLRECVLGRD